MLLIQRISVFCELAEDVDLAAVRVILVVLGDDLEYSVLVLVVPVEIVVEDLDEIHRLNGFRTLQPLRSVAVTLFGSLRRSFDLVEELVDLAPKSDLRPRRHVVVEPAGHAEQDLVVRVDAVFLFIEMR